VKAVSDITLNIHLAGQLLYTQNKYAFGNFDTAKMINPTIFLYNSEISLEWEETSFVSINSEDCKNYNDSWTFDDCLIDSALFKLGNQSSLLSNLLRPTDFTMQQGIEREILANLYGKLLSQNTQRACLPDCRSLSVKMRAEASTTLAQPTRGIGLVKDKFPIPLPAMLIDVNITLPAISKLNEVRT